MHCNEIENHLTDYLRDELSAPIRKAVMEHLAGCADCRWEVQSIEGLWSELAQVSGAEPEMETMRVRFRAMLESSGSAPRSAVKSWKSSWPVLRIVLAMMFLTIAVFAAQQNGILTVVISRLVLQQSTQPVAQPQTGILAGRLLFPDGGPAANMRVSVIAVAGRAATIKTQTDSDGHYRLEKIPPGRYHVTAGEMDYLIYYPGSTGISNAKIVEVTGGTTINDLDFSLSRTIGVRVYGHVVRASNQVPTSAQRAILDGGNPAVHLSVPVARDGSFEFSDIRPGNYRIRASQLAGAQPQAISVSSRDLSVKLVIPHTVTITGMLILNEAGLIPHLGLEFTSTGNGASSYRLSTSTGSDGEFTTTLPTGEYRLTTLGLPSGYSLKSMKSGSVDLLKNPLKITATDSPVIVVTLAVSSPPPWVRVRGHVLGLGNGISATGISLSTPRDTSLTNRTVSQGAAQVPISNDGAFEFPMVLPGTYAAQLLPRASTALAGQMLVVVPAGRGNISDLEIAFPSMKQITGHILWEGDGPRSSIGFDLGNDSNQRVLLRAEPDWRFKIWVPEGEHAIKLTAIPDGYVLKSLTYGATDLLTNPLKPSQTDIAELQVVLTPLKPDAWVKVSGKVVGMPTAAVSALPSIDRRVTIDRMPNDSLSGGQDIALARDNTFVFPKILPGTYIIRARIAGVVGSTTVAVGNTDVTNIEIPFPKLATVIGHAVMEGNGPIPNFRLGLTASTGSNLILVQPKPDGSFTLDLPEGEFTVGLSTLLSLPTGVTASAMTYGKVDLRKQPLKVSADKPEQLHVTFKAAGPSTPVHVSGHVINGNAGMPIVLNGFTIGQAIQGTVGPDGAFDFQNIFPGRYTLRAAIQSTVPGNTGPKSRLLGSMAVVVGTSDMTDIEFKFPKQVPIVVRTTIEGGVQAPYFTLDSTPSFTLEPTNGENTLSLTVPVTQNGVNTVLMPVGNRQVSVPQLPMGYTVKSLTHGAANLLKEPLRISEGDMEDIAITISVDPAATHKISGHVTGISDAIHAQSIFMAGPISLSVPVAADGSFVSPPLPAGTYGAMIFYHSSTATAPVSTSDRKSIVIGDKDITGLELAIPAPSR